MEHIVSIKETREKVSQEIETITDRQKTFKLIFKASDVFIVPALQIPLLKSFLFAFLIPLPRKSLKGTLA